MAPRHAERELFNRMSMIPTAPQKNNDRKDIAKTINGINSSS